MSRHYIDFSLIEKHPNKYNFTTKNIKTVKILDWEKLKTKFYQNFAKDKDGRCWDKMLCTNVDDMMDDEFYLGFWENGEVESHFYSYGGMCGYEFSEFYKISDIENKYDMDIQIMAIRLLNELVDEGIISYPEK